MILLPAIDLLGGRCVRLRRGDFLSAHQVADDPLQTAQCFYQSGARWIHLVDLDGATTGQAQNAPVVHAIAQNTSLKVEVGGGIRDMNAIETYLAMGVSRVILGSAALQNPDLVKKAVRAFGDKIAVGIDAKKGFVCAGGWLESSQVDYLELAKAMEDAGVRTMIFTDIDKDGMEKGPNLGQLEAFRKAVSCQIVASGGIRSLEDLEALDRMGIPAAILGKALYSGSLDLSQAVQWANRP